MQSSIQHVKQKFHDFSLMFLTEAFATYPVCGRIYSCHSI